MPGLGTASQKASYARLGGVEDDTSRASQRSSRTKGEEDSLQGAWEAARGRKSKRQQQKRQRLSHKDVHRSPKQPLSPTTTGFFSLIPGLAVCEARYHHEFSEGATLGSGAFEVVFRCTNLLDQREYAVKKVVISSDPSFRPRLAKVCRVRSRF
jgi:hypothetical protein